MIKLGIFCELEVEKEVDFGYYLTDGEESILLPMNEITEPLEIGSDIEAFIYTDSEDRYIATLKKPLIQVGEFANLMVVDRNQYGCFLDWGLPKDLFLPFKNQGKKLKAGEEVVVFLYEDILTERLVATTKLEPFFDKNTEDLEENQSIEILPFEDTDLGVKVIIDQQWEGLIFHNNIFKELPKEPSKAYVGKVREDGKVDVVLQPFGYRKVEGEAQIIYDALKEENFIPLNDKSSPYDIEQKFGVSKKVFKKSIGKLYKEKLIKIKEDGIELI